MITKKAGTILLNLENKQIALIYRPSKNDYSFPKGHLEENESLEECAVRETEEETMRANHLISNKEIYIDKYVTPSGEDVENYMYIAIDDGPTQKDIRLEDREIVEWYNFEDVEGKLSYESLRKLWNFAKDTVFGILKNNNYSHYN